MRKDVSFYWEIVESLLNYLQEDLCTIEIKDWQQEFRHVQFWLQKLIVHLITINMRSDSFLIGCLNFIFVYSYDIESNIISVRFNSIREEINRKLTFWELQILKWESELSAKNQYLHYLLWINKFFHFVKKSKDDAMWKHDWRIVNKLIGSFVVDHNWQKVKKHNRSHLVLINLLMLNCDQLVSLIICQMKLTHSSHEMDHHLNIISFQKYKQIVSIKVEVRIVWKSHL